MIQIRAHLCSNFEQKAKAHFVTYEALQIFPSWPVSSPVTSPSPPSSSHMGLSVTPWSGPVCFYLSAFALILPASRDLPQICMASSKLFFRFLVKHVPLSKVCLALLSKLAEPSAPKLLCLSCFVFLLVMYQYLTGTECIFIYLV